MKTIRTEKENDYEYRLIDNPREERGYQETLEEIYEHIFELESNKPIGKCSSWDKKYKYYKEALKRYE